MTFAPRLVSHAVTLLVLFLCCGCVSFSSLQSARTLKRNGASFFAALGYESLVIERSRGLDSSTEKSVEEVKIPIFEYGFRYGVLKGLDVGLRTATLSSSVVDVKYALSSGLDFATAAGLGVGYGSLKSSDYSARFIDVHVPFYTTYDFARWSSIFFVPRLVYRHSSTTFYTESTTYGAALLGGSVGFILGEKVALVPEVSYFKDAALAGDSGIMQVMIGLAFGLDNLDRDSSDPAPRPNGPKPKI